MICVFTVVSFIFVASRLYSRYLGRNFGWDDYIIIFSMAILIGDTGIVWKYILLSGTGYHVYDLPKKTVHQQIVVMQWSFAIQMLYHPMMGSIRASIIMFLFRMKDHRRRIRYSLHIVFWLNILYSVATTLGNILQCNPVRYTWMKPAMDSIGEDGAIVRGGTCIDSRTFVLASCALSIFMDLIIIPIPSIMVWNLQMSVRTKVLVVIVMSLGWVATGVSVGRFIVYYYRFAPTNKDRTWDIGIGISIVEPSVHIITACAPATKCLFRYLFPSFAAERTPAYYEDRHTATQTPHMSKFGSRTSRSTGNFHFGFSKNMDQDTVIDDSKLGTSMENIQKDSVFSMSRLESNSSHEDAQSKAQLKNKMSMEAVRSARTSCTRTAYTETSEPDEAQPEHCLAQAR